MRAAAPDVSPCQRKADVHHVVGVDVVEAHRAAVAQVLRARIHILGEAEAAVALTVGASLVPVIGEAHRVGGGRAVAVGRRHRVGEGDGLAGGQEVQVGVVDRVAPRRAARRRRVGRAGR